MVRLLILLCLLPCIAFADQLDCGNNHIIGKYENDLSGGNLATFTTEDGQKIIFSFNNCFITITK
jgi:hypothetical protein